jgi:hypothetical protein
MTRPAVVLSRCASVWPWKLISREVAAIAHRSGMPLGQQQVVEGWGEGAPTVQAESRVCCLRTAAATRRHGSAQATTGTCASPSRRRGRSRKRANGLTMLPQTAAPPIKAMPIVARENGVSKLHARRVTGGHARLNQARARILRLSHA